MKKFFIQITFLVLFIFAALYLSFNSGSLSTSFNLGFNQNNLHRKIKINETIISVEIADNTSKRSQGLGNRASLDENAGMLFIYTDTSKHRFWMKGMRFPLDFIYIRGGKIVDILKNAPPPQEDQKDETLTIYEPITPIDMMLEVNSGFADNHNIKVGDTVFLTD